MNKKTLVYALLLGTLAGGFLMSSREAQAGFSIEVGFEHGTHHSRPIPVEYPRGRERRRHDDHDYGYRRAPVYEVVRYREPYFYRGHDHGHSWCRR